MRKLLLLGIVLSSIYSVSAPTKDKLRAISLSSDQIRGGIYEGQPTTHFEMLGSNGRSASVYKSPDGAFSMGGFEIVIDENTKREHRYENFPRNEFMYFTKGGMKLIDDDGDVVEAGPGEIIFIPKGWTGTRIFTGDEAMQKFSVVYQ